MDALAQRHPEGFDGFDLGHAIPPVDRQAYIAALKPGFNPLTDQEITESAAAWRASEPERLREVMTVSVPQFRKGLRTTEITLNGQQTSLKAAVETAIGAIQDPDAKADMEDWYHSPPAQIRRTYPRVEALRILLSITPEQADEMWQTWGDFQ